MSETDQAISIKYQEGFSNFTNLFDEIIEKIDMNEAQTRFEIIDDILYNCLGWSKHKSIRVEEQTEKGFADYIICTTRDVAVLEAKRQSISFRLPVSDKPIKSSIKSLTKGNGDLRAAINQVLGYAQSKGIPIAIVSNGTQYVAFVASRSDGNPPIDGQAVAFTGLSQIKDNFIEFWNCFSKEGIMGGSLNRMLLKSAMPTIPTKPSSFIMDYPGNSSRNELQNDLMLLSEMVLEDFIHEERLEKEFLKNCYCESGALSQYSILARDIIKNRYEPLDDTTGVKIQGVVDKKGISEDFLDASISRRPIILIGDVGVGKTTFIRNLILSEDGILGRNDIAVHVNLGENAILSENVTTGALTKISQILLDEYHIDIHEGSFVRGVYKGELQRLKVSIYKDLEPSAFLQKEIETLEQLINDNAEHIKRSIDYIETRKIHKTPSKVVIFLDNTDQRTPQDQQEIFLVAHELSTQSLATVFVSIRPETFYLSHREGVLKAYHPKVFTIEPPRIDLVLQKRIKFALMIARGEIAAPSLGEQKVKLSNLTTMLEVMLRTLESSYTEQKSLMTTIDNIAAGNVRSAVDMVKNFLSSAHTNTKKILEIEKDYPGTYFIPMHEFMRSLIYGDYKFFNPGASLISNIFTITSLDPKEYLLKLILINELIFLGSSNVSKQGFVDTKLVYAHFQALGYMPEQIEQALEYCLNEELIENPINSILHDSNVAENAIRITTRGAVYITGLAGTFVYIDAMLVDTPILDRPLLESITESFSNSDITIEDRLIRAESFMTYINDMYLNSLRIGADTRVDVLIPKVMEQFRESVAKVKSSLERTALANARRDQ